MTRIVVDNRDYQVDGSQNLLHACLSLGLDLEYFCWHPALGSLGACRQCAVKMFKDEHDQHGRLVMACMTPAKDGTRIAIRDPDAHAFRAGIVEGLMLNHPHDCPVCDEGGECHLQDMTVMSGHVQRRSRFPKRTFRSQYLGPFVHHEMNRCIQCYRCVRFYRDYAGGRDLDAFGLRNLVFFGRYRDGVLESEYSGNLVEVCPTGVFTDATLKQHYTRKWDLQFAPSVCVHCGEGCNTSPGERYGLLRRIVNRYHHDINGYFLCDRGRYGYGFVNAEARLRQATLTGPGGRTPVARASALARIAELVGQGRNMVGIGSPRASLEANFALRALVGPERFSCGLLADEQRVLGSMLERLRESRVRSPSLAEVEASDAILVLGEDLPNVAPRMALAVRQATRQRSYAIAAEKGIPTWQDQAVRMAAQDQRSPLVLATSVATRLDDIAAQIYRAAPDDLVRFALAVAHALDPGRPEVPGLGAEVAAQARRAARALAEARRPTVISGPGACSEALVGAAALVADTLVSPSRTVGLAYTAPECNSLGLAMLGGCSLDQVVQTAEAGRIETLVVLENDLARRLGLEVSKGLLDRVAHVVVLDCLTSPTSEAAEIVLPVASFAESEGTLVNREPRAQRFFRVFAPESDVVEDWRCVRDILAASGRPEAGAWQELDDLTAAVGKSIPGLERIVAAAPSAQFRMDGRRVPRAPNRYSGRTAMTADRSVHEPQTPIDPDSSLAFQMEGDPRQPPAPLTPYFWAPGWNSVQAVNKYQSAVGGELRTGEAGTRLIEPASGAQPAPSPEVPGPFNRQPGRFLALPTYRVFGSDETSVRAPELATLVSKPTVGLRESDARSLGVKADEVVRVQGEGWTVALPVEVRDELAAGTVVVVAGYPETAALRFPAWVRLVRP